MTADGPSHRRGVRIQVVGAGMRYATPYGHVTALDDVSLTVESGANVAVVGPSGSGKSTLLGLLAGLELPTAGEVRVGDYLLSGMSERRRAILRRQHFGLVFQADNLQPFLTVAENIALQASLAGTPEDAAGRRELLEALDIGALADRFPDQLSGGQRQRVAVARALVHRPSLVLADEPTGALDVVSAGKAIDLLLRLHRAQGTTLVVVTHDATVADRMDAVVTMRGGRVTLPPRGTPSIPEPARGTP